MALEKTDMNPTKQVLFVDDDELTLLCYERLLSRHFTIEKAVGPEEALDALNRDTFAVIASDMQMPGMNGIALLKKAKEKCPQTVRILLTGNGDNQPEAPGNGGLLFKLLSKPCPTSDLIAAIQDALDQFERNSRQVTP
jgi:DNA-binding NtrC family response regulator